MTSTDETDGRVRRVARIIFHPVSVAVWGTALTIGAFLLVRGDRDLAAIYLFATIVAWLVCGLYILYRGWQDDGIVGALFSYRYPLGGILEDASGRRFTAIWLLGIATICSLLLALRHPEVGNKLIPSRPTRTAHDLLLPPN